MESRAEYVTYNDVTQKGGKPHVRRYVRPPEKRERTEKPREGLALEAPESDTSTTGSPPPVATCGAAGATRFSEPNRGTASLAMGPPQWEALASSGSNRVCQSESARMACAVAATAAVDADASAEESALSGEAIWPGDDGEPG